MGALGDVGATFTQWRTWFLMANQDISMRYRRSVIGPFWISFSLAGMIGAMALLYGQIFELAFETYLLWLGSSLLVWFLLSAMITEGCTIATEAEPQLRSIPIPMPVLAARMTHRNFVIFLHNVIVVAGLFAIFGYAPGPAIAMAPAGLAVLLLFGYFLALTLGPLCLRFRDITLIVSNIVQVSFFVTPIIWQPNQGRVDSIFVNMNPLHHLIELVRAPVLGQYPTALNWTVSLGVLGFVMALGLISTNISRRKIFTWL